MTCKLVYIEWHDAHGVEPNWEFMEELIEKVDHICIAKSVGWLVKENKFQVVVVPHQIEASPLTRAQGCGEMTIPRSSIRRMVSFNLPRIPHTDAKRGGTGRRIPKGIRGPGVPDLTLPKPTGGKK